MVQSFPRYMSRWMPRVYGKSPGTPRSRAGSRPRKSSGPYNGSIGTPLIVVNCRSTVFMCNCTTRLWLQYLIYRMLKPTIFREYDIRGVADVELLDADVEILGQAFGTYL